MARLGCKCGKVLSSIDSPNDVELIVFEGATINHLLSTTPEILLTDVMLDYDIQDEHCWYCKECGRVYVFENNCQMYNRVYLIHNYIGEDSLESVLNLHELYIYTDKQIQEPTDKNFDYSLKDFFDNLPHPYRYYVTEDGLKVYAYDTLLKRIDHFYELETACIDESAINEASSD